MTSADFLPLLAASRATPAFQADLDAFLARAAAPRIAMSIGAPRVKVLRVIAQLLSSEPNLTIESVAVTGASGCADFVGSAAATDADGVVHHFEFSWNCEWKARQLGYVDGFGFPDQIRAAQEFGWACFERWERQSARVEQSA